MVGPNEFWLTYHQLLEAYKAEGKTPDARTAKIMDQFRGMPPSVRRHIAGDMDEFLTMMAELLITVRTEGSHSPRELLR